VKSIHAMDEWFAMFVYPSDGSPMVFVCGTAPTLDSLLHQEKTALFR